MVVFPSTLTSSHKCQGGGEREVAGDLQNEDGPFAVLDLRSYNAGMHVDTAELITWMVVQKLPYSPGTGSLERPRFVADPLLRPSE